jgi:hypothetical protein
VELPAIGNRSPISYTWPFGVLGSSRDIEVHAGRPASKLIAESSAFMTSSLLG